jgi:hypothetical protein
MVKNDFTNFVVVYVLHRESIFLASRTFRDEILDDSEGDAMTGKASAES